MAAGQPTPVTLHWAQYDGLGNICAKRIEGAGLGYIYAGRAGCGVTTANGGGTSATVGAHRVASVGDGVRTYAYDARGNQTFRNMPGTASDRTIAYSLDDKAHEVDVGGNKTRYWYGSDGQRYKREDTGRKILYLGNVEVEIAGSTTTIRRTVAGVMIQTIVGSTATNHYQFHDVLGSLIRTTNAAGTAIDNLDYKAFGLRVSYSDPQTVSYTGSSISLRGFTGHEHIDKVDMDVIHMNGRIYDPELGRFLQADPVIQAPGNLQSWNAYTYVFNNPLAYTDPTGLFSLRKALGIVIVVVAAVTQQHWAISAATKFWGTVGFGALAGGVSTGSWQGAVWGAISAAAFYGVGSYFENLSNLNDWAGVETVGNTGLTLSELGFKTLSHGAIGGVMSKLQGGKFGNGFASAGVTEAFAPAIAKAGNPGGRVIVASIVGGTASEISGGKFANGAVTAAFQAATRMIGQRMVQKSTEDIPTDLSNVPSDDLRRMMLSDDPDDRVAAAKAAIAHFSIGGKGYKIRYDARLSETASIDPFGEVILGPGAFRSWSWLGSTLGHEIEVHWMRQYREWGSYGGNNSRWLREVQAHRYNVDSAARFGNSAVEVRFHQYWANRYYQALSPAAKSLADQGVYRD